MKEETGRDYSTKLTVIADRFLTEEEGAEFGGIMLYAYGRRIVVANTLLDRMNLVFEMALPQIRAMLFP
jgi:vacuolar-type H+-ATPase subunit E/Vma4